MNLPLVRPVLFMLVFLFTLGGCKPSGTTTSTANPTTPSTPSTPPSSGGTVTLSGTLTFDHVPQVSGKLNYAGTIQKPMRNVYLELLNATNNAVLASYNTNDSGQYSFSVTSGASVKLRITASMKTPVVIIQDNTNAGAEYALVTSSFTLSANTTRDVRALSGWSGTNAAGSYSGTRQAAPFAMLDSIYTIVKKMTTARPSIVLPTCRLNWSINNVSVDGDKTIGQIGTSHYLPSSGQMYILGQADVDSDEYDRHVIVHEWGHFFEDKLSRSDSPGGSHGSGDAKDMALAFGEGWGNALSAMAFDPDVYYTDTYGTRQQSGFQIDMEAGTDSKKGWYSETSVHQILYDLYDSTNETNDALSMGIGPIIDVLVGSQKTTPATTSIFSFIKILKTNVSAAAAAINALVASKSISTITDIYGTGETNNDGWDKNLPASHSMTLGGAAVPISLYGGFGGTDYYGLYNSLYNSRTIRFTATSANTRLVVTTTDTFQIEVFQQGSVLYRYYRPRTSAAAIGPFTFDMATTAGLEYRINAISDQDEVFDPAAIVTMTLTGSAL